MFVVFGVDAGQHVRRDVIAALDAVRPPRQRNDGECENGETGGNCDVQHGGEVILVTLAPESEPGVNSM